MQRLQPWIHCGRVLVGLASDLVRFLRISLRSQTALAAENLFLRKQLALYRERQVKSQWASDPVRLALVLFARCFAWRGALTIVQPATLVRWHRNAFRLFWRWRSRPGRPRIPAELQRLIAVMARDNVTWGSPGVKSALARNCSSSSGYACRRARSAGTWAAGGKGEESRPEPVHSAGRPSCEITPKPSWRVISVWW